jgi:hypothetical protein
MKSYREALNISVNLCNMPSPNTHPAKFLLWAEDICELLAEIYNRSYEQVTEDMQERLNLLDEDEDED